MSELGKRVQNGRIMRMWTQVRLAREAGVSPTTVSGVETGKIGRPHFGTLDKLARALGVAPEELLDSRESVEQQGPVPLSLGWARETGDGEFESGLEGAPLKSLDSLSHGAGCRARAPSEALWGVPRGKRAGAIHKTSDPGGSGAVGIGEGFGDGTAQPG